MACDVSPVAMFTFDSVQTSNTKEKFKHNLTVKAMEQVNWN